MSYSRDLHTSNHYYLTEILKLNIRDFQVNIAEIYIGLFTKLDHFMHLITKLDQKTGANATHFTKLDHSGPLITKLDHSLTKLDH